MLPLIDFVKDYPWFAPLMAALVILAAIALMTKMVKLSLENTRSIREMIMPRTKSVKDLYLAESKADDSLTTLANDFGADRAILALFHNGKTSIGNDHFLSLSVMAEGSSGKFPRIVTRIQSIPLKTYGKWVDRLVVGKSISAPDIAIAATEVPCAYPVFEQHSIKSMYVYPVVVSSGDVVGCVSLEYCQERRELGDIEQRQIRARGQAIYAELHKGGKDV